MNPFEHVTVRSGDVTASTSKSANWVHNFPEEEAHQMTERIANSISNYAQCLKAKEAPGPNHAIVHFIELQQPKAMWEY